MIDSGEGRDQSDRTQQKRSLVWRGPIDAGDTLVFLPRSNQNSFIALYPAGAPIYLSQTSVQNLMEGRRAPPNFVIGVIGSLREITPSSGGETSTAGDEKKPYLEADLREILYILPPTRKSKARKKSL